MRSVLRVLVASVCSQVEDAKKVLILYGNRVSQVLKDVLVDLHKLKRVRTGASFAPTALHECSKCTGCR